MKRALPVALASLLLGGCFAIYDYGDYVPGDANTGSTGETCDPSTGTPRACDDCLNSGQCTSQLSACGGGDISMKCLDWRACTSKCCEPSCFQACDDEYLPNDVIEAVYACMCDKCNTAETCQDLVPACQ